MPKRLIQQRRGRGTSRFRSPSHRYKAKVSFPSELYETWTGVIKDIINCPGHTAPLIQVKWENGMESFMIAPYGVKVGDTIQMGPAAEVKPGNILPLRKIPEGTEIFMLELRPGDGGKLLRSAGVFGKVVSKEEGVVYVQLPSKVIKALNPLCRAIIGRAAGSGRAEKPVVKAGKKYHMMKARNRYWPIVAAHAMNAVNHPFGSKHRRNKKPKSVSRNAPPGAKVGSIASRRTGYKR